MAKYRDKRNLGKSNLCEYRTNETASDRHCRRLETNLKRETELKEWCQSVGIDLKVTNNGHHWKITQKNRICEWWPSSAKLVFQKNWAKGIHCHDHEQVKKELTKKWGVSQK